MTKRQALHLPLLLPLFALVPPMALAAIILRVGFVLLRYLDSVYRPRHYTATPDHVGQL